MKEPPSLEDFNALLNTIASKLYDDVFSELGDQAWCRCFLDARFDPEGSGAISCKIRVQTANERVVSATGSSLSFDLIAMRRLRESLFANAWYGLLLTVDANRQCQAKLNYDPKCYDDPAFYAD
jgi:hypothetical protein